MFLLSLLDLSALLNFAGHSLPEIHSLPCSVHVSPHTSLSFSQFLGVHLVRKVHLKFLFSNFYSNIYHCLLRPSPLFCWLQLSGMWGKGHLQLRFFFLSVHLNLSHSQKSHSPYSSRESACLHLFLLSENRTPWKMCLGIWTMSLSFLLICYTFNLPPEYFFQCQCLFISYQNT